VLHADVEMSASSNDESLPRVGARIVQIDMSIHGSVPGWTTKVWLSASLGLAPERRSRCLELWPRRTLRPLVKALRQAK
jgi:hypothetical protein